MFLATVRSVRRDNQQLAAGIQCGLDVLAAGGDFAEAHLVALDVLHPQAANLLAGFLAADAADDVDVEMGSLAQSVLGAEIDVQLLLLVLLLRAALQNVRRIGIGAIVELGHLAAQTLQRKYSILFLSYVSHYLFRLQKYK